MKHTRRAYLRSYREATVEIRNKDSDQHFHVKMNDCCRGGMQLSAEQFIEPGSAIVIRPTEHQDDILSGALRGGCPAQVVWCRPLADGTPQFIIGVRFLAPPAH